VNTARNVAEGVRFSSSVFVIRELMPTNSIIHNSFNLNLTSSAVLTNGTWRHDLRFNENYNLTTDMEIGGSLYINGGTFNLNGGEINVGINVIVGGGTLNMNGGRMFVGRDFRVQSESVAADLNRTYSSSSGRISMINENDYIRVYGFFITQATNTHNGFLTNGVMEVRGNFTQSTSSSDQNFLATGNHRVILNGTRLQNVSFGSNNSRFNILEITKPVDTGYTFSRTPLWNTLVENFTQNDAPEAPRNLRAAETAVNSIRLEWDAGDDKAVGYDVFRDGLRIGTTRNNTFIDSGLRSNTMYAYYVIAYDITRNMSDWSNILETRTNVNTNAPSPPGNFRAVADGETTIRLSWTASSAVAPIEGYEIYRDNILIGTLMGQGTAFTDNTAFPGLYTYYVKAFDIDGNISSPSANVTVDNMPPTTPVLILESYQGTSVTLRWTAEDNVGVTEYHVYQNGIRMSVTSNNFFTNNNLFLNLTYEFHVIAFDAARNRSERSNSIVLTTEPDTEPPVVTRITPIASLRRNSIPLTVSARDNMGVAFVLLQYSHDEENWLDITTLTANNSTLVNLSYNFNVTGLPDGSIFVRAIATDTSGNTSSETNTPVVEYFVRHTPPNPPTNLRTNISNGRIELLWNAPADFDTIRFRIYRASGNDSNHIIIQNNHRFVNFFDGNIDVGVDYYYYVTAIDSIGNESVKSETIHVTIADDNVNPEILSISPRSGSKINGQQRISISAWDNIRLASITVEYALEGSNNWILAHTQTLNSYHQTINFLLDTKDFTTGNYIIRAQVTDWYGNKSEYAAVTYCYRELTLTAPRLTATPGGWQVHLSWSAADDNSIAGYRILRRSAESNNFTVIGSITGNSFIDRNVTAGRTFFYIIEAEDSHGNTIRSPIISAVPTHEDNINPIANAGISERVSLSGDTVSFDGSRSWDNHFVAEYLWDFGDGNTSADVRPSHTFNDEGIHTVTLTVRDSAGNSNTTSVTVNVFDSTLMNYIEFQIIDSTTGSPLRNAVVHSEIPGLNGVDLFEVNSSGIARILARTGTYTFYFYQEGYMPVSGRFTVDGSGRREVIRLDRGEVVTGDVTVERLTLNEIIALGIDISDPDNQYVFQHTMEIIKNNQTQKITFSTNSSGEMVAVDGRVVSNSSGNNSVIISFDNSKSFHEIEGNNNPNAHRPPSNGSNNSGSSSNNVQIRTLPNPSPGRPASIIMLDVSTDISWLKEFFNVSLTVVNNATPEFPITHSTAVINIPSGLSLANTAGVNSRIRDIGVIDGGETATESWIIRGDEKGEYDISVDFNGLLMPFGTNIGMTFETTEPIKVWGGDALHLDILQGVWDEATGTAKTMFMLTNISDIPIYNLALDLSVVYKFLDVSEVKLFLPNGVIETIPWENGRALYNRREEFLPALLEDGADIVSMALMPGESIMGYFTSTTKQLNEQQSGFNYRLIGRGFR
jgi:chitodextrinase